MKNSNKVLAILQTSRVITFTVGMNWLMITVLKSERSSWYMYVIPPVLIVVSIFFGIIADYLSQ